MEQKTKRDCYSEITNAIIADLEKGVAWLRKEIEEREALIETLRQLSAQ